MEINLYNKTHFHVNDFLQKLVFKPRQKATRKVLFRSVYGWESWEVSCLLSAKCLPLLVFSGAFRPVVEKKSLTVSSRGELCFCGGKGRACGNHNKKLSTWSVWFVSNPPPPPNYSHSPQSKQYRVLKITEVGRGWSTLWGMQLLLRKFWDENIMSDIVINVLSNELAQRGH